MSDLTLVSLFAGIGGFEEAFRRAGVRTVASVEIDKHARGVLARQLPETVLFDDVTKVSGDDLRRAGFVPARGILTAGFPCQDISIAGAGAGLAGSRSGLFWEIVRLLDELHPRWFVLENVPRLLSINGGRDMGTVVGALVECGYGCSWRVLDAQYFGVPQRRRRIFIVGCFGDFGRASAEVFFEQQGGGGDSTEGGEARPGVTGTAADRIAESSRIVALHENQRGELSTNQTMGTLATGGGKPGQGYPAVLVEGVVRKMTPRECERLQGFPDGWTDGQAATVRYRQLGNAVAIPVVQWIAERLVAVDGSS
jgi:DNA (cytosine-5)-methyltransferase 1